jgi:hypothetical protein
MNQSLDKCVISKREFLEHKHKHFSLATNVTLQIYNMLLEEIHKLISSYFFTICQIELDLCLNVIESQTLRYGKILQVLCSSLSLLNCNSIGMSGAQ